MLEGESDPFPVLKVDSRLIRVNGKDAVLERIAEMTEVTFDGCHGYSSLLSYDVVIGSRRQVRMWRTPDLVGQEPILH